MNVSPINVITPKAYTKHGNEYRKSNAAKAAFTTVGMLSSSVTLKKAEVAISDALSLAKKTNIKYTFPKSFKFFATLVTTLSALGLGVITDAIVNKANETTIDKKDLNVSDNVVFKLDSENSTTDYENKGVEIGFHQG